MRGDVWVFRALLGSKPRQQYQRAVARVTPAKQVVAFWDCQCPTAVAMPARLAAMHSWNSPLQRHSYHSQHSTWWARPARPTALVQEQGLCRRRHLATGLGHGSPASASSQGLSLASSPSLRRLGKEDEMLQDFRTRLAPWDLYPLRCRTRPTLLLPVGSVVHWLPLKILLLPLESVPLALGHSLPSGARIWRDGGSSRSTDRFVFIGKTCYIRDHIGLRDLSGHWYSVRPSGFNGHVVLWEDIWFIFFRATASFIIYNGGGSAEYRR
ncbi:hypothetical protein B0H10DRAFT_485954 [Mycena sp. CBHHK59/15]|nr:hypothetical protein B0H10DRAFT_485954 [Mycena sp. CBHHK59/15]